MSDANKRQVGGDHYKTGGTEHWDLFGPEYHMAVAVKYVSRWRKKDGVKDLEKALHYAEKLLEVVGEGAQNTYSRGRRTQVEAWARNAGLDWAETQVVMDLLFWHHNDDIRRAIGGILYLMGRVAPKFEGVDVTWEIKKGEDFTVAWSTPENGGQHASLWPWWAKTVPPHLSEFYRVLGTEGGRVLEPVVTVPLPAELVLCYDIYGDGVSVIRIGNVPPSLREYYPTLRRELSPFEYAQVPSYQKKLYVESTTPDSKYILTNGLWAE